MNENTLIFDTSSFDPMKTGRLKKHLRILVRYQKTVMTHSDMYEKFGPVGKRTCTLTKEGREVYSGGFWREGEKYQVTEYYLVNAEGFLLQIPKLVYDACTLSELERVDA